MLRSGYDGQRREGDPLTLRSICALVALLCAASVWADDPLPKREPTRPPVDEPDRTRTGDPRDAPLPAGPALLSVSKKNGPTKTTGLWLRSIGGKTKRIWKGEPYDACALPDRTTLVCERWKGRVLRLDPNGKILFEKKGLQTPVDSELAFDGTIVVVLNVPGQVVGIHPKTGKRLWTRGGFTTPFDALCLPKGGVVVADSGAGRVVEYDAKGRVRWQTKGLGFVNTIDRLRNGNLLVTNWSGGEVVELDRKGKRVWRVKLAGTIYRAHRRRDGTTLVVEGEKGQLHILDRKGRILKSESFSPGCVDYEPLPGI